MPHARRQFGNEAEKEAARFLKKAGMKILERQYRTRFGEIDLIAKDGDEIVFVEVKARKSAVFGYPEESVTARKLEKIARVGEHYLARKGDVPHRIDVVAIEYDQDPPRITHLRAVG